MESTTINGFKVNTSSYHNHRVPNHARKLCAALDRDHDAVDRIDYSIQRVTVWLDADTDAERTSFDIPAGYEVDKTGVYGGGVAIDLVRTDG